MLRQYEEDGSAAWIYTLALIAYREQDINTQGIVEEAREANPHVPAMLAGLKRLAPSNDGYISMGGADEATAYVEQNGGAWRAVPGAVEWLVERTAVFTNRPRSSTMLTAGRSTADIARLSVSIVPPSVASSAISPSKTPYQLHSILPSFFDLAIVC